MKMNVFNYWHFVAAVFIFLSTSVKLSQGEFNATLTDAVDSGIDLIDGTIRNTLDLLPKYDELFDGSKQLIAGYPFLFAFSAVQFICTSAAEFGSIQPKYTPNITDIKIQLHTKCTKHEYTLLEGEKILENPYFDSSKKVVLISSGWLSGINDSEFYKNIGKAYFCRGDVNVIFLDATQFMNTLYTWAAFNTDEIGKYLSTFLVELNSIVSEKDIHLIGHSLGAHISGAAGRYFYYKTGRNISRITGLDPANPCFNEGENLSGLQRGDADFIDVIHSNPGGAGVRHFLGDADFYPHGLNPLPPGCFNIDCAHSRSYKFYAESVYPGNEHNFLGTRCTSLLKLKRGDCIGQKFPMGYAVPFDLRGNYFLDVNKDTPFGQNGDPKHMKSLEKCGLCEDKQF